MSDQNMDRYLELFLEESTEQIDQLNDGLLRLEKEGATEEIVEDIFRSAHTLKSSAAFVGQNKMSELSHRMEDLLQQVRENKLKIETELVNLLFRIVDRVKNSLSQIANGEEMNDDFNDLKIEIESYHGATPKNESFPDDIVDENLEPQRISTEVITSEKSSIETQNNAKESNKNPIQIDSSDLIVATAEMDKEISGIYNGRNVFSCLVRIEPDAPMKNMKLLLLSENLARTFEVYTSIPDASAFEGAGDFNEYRFILIGDCTSEDIEKECQIDLVSEIKIKEYLSHKEELGLSTERRTTTSEKDLRIPSKNIKVSSDKIDYLMNNVGELVIVNSGLQNVYDDLQQYFGDTTFLSELKGKIDQAERIVRDLQSGIMKTRMMPVGVVFNRFARPVRDLAKKLNKEVELKFSGEDTELDKNIIDVLGEPLLHIMRNSLDHGFELPDDRKKNGKPEIGTLSLKSYQSGNNVFIEIKDDGRGLDRDKILSIAKEKNLMNSESEPTDDEIYQMIFHPGFSTSNSVTDVSGRGVGMGVVKKLMDDFKGTVQIENHPGEGCSILMSFPLTLAIVSAVLIKLQDEEYAFPLADVIETIYIAKDEITSLQGREIINLRGDILSVYHLCELLGLPEESIVDSEEYPVVIVNSANRKMGFIVSGFSGKMEIVIKSLNQNFKSVNGLIGACLLGDGRIVMVVDVHGLLEIAQQSKSKITGQSQEEFIEALHGYNKYVLAQKIQGRESTDSIESVLRKKLNDLNGSDLDKSSESLPQIKSPTVPFENNETDSQNISLPLTTEKNSDSLGSVLTSQKTDVETSSATKTSQLEFFPEPIKDTETTSNKIKEIENTLIQTAPIRDAFEELSEDDFLKLQKVVKKGMSNSGAVLSQLLGVEVKVSVPEFKTIQFDELATQYNGECFAIQLPIEGDVEGMNLLIFDATSGLQAAGELMGLPADEIQKLPIEDVESVLCELANIVGSSILNEFSNSTDLTVMPCPPEFYHGEYSEVIKNIKDQQTYQEELQILSIMTDFFRDEVEFFGRLFVIPTTRSMAKILNHLD